MSRRAGRALAAALAVGVTLSLGSAALAASVGMLKQFKVPTANGQPRAITNGSDGNVWFTEGTEFRTLRRRSDGSRRAAASPSSTSTAISAS